MGFDEIDFCVVMGCQGRKMLELSSDLRNFCTWLLSGNVDLR